MTINDKIWWTRKAKIEQETRLLRYEFHSQALLIWYSFFYSYNINSTNTQE